LGYGVTDVANNTLLAVSLNIENPFAILAICVFAVSVVASVFGPARWNTERRKRKFALIGDLLLFTGFATLLDA
jgi:hypothetical protein